ncbi:MAG: YceI family protein [Dehalococcoidia bacterium]
MNIKRLAFGALIAAVAATAVAVGAFVFLFNDAPDEVSLDAAVEAAAQSTAATIASSSTTATADAGETSTSATTVPATDGDLSGTWTLVNDGSSFVGYRVQEELASIGATTAVGRTTEVSGSLEYDGSAITAVSIEADVSALESDEDRRDQALQRQALETGTYPLATFVLTEPIEVGDLPADGESLSATATGELTLHGVTQTVSIPLEGAFVDGQVVVVGSTTIQFADYGIDSPSSMAVLSVDDHATLELQLIFAQL